MKNFFKYTSTLVLLLAGQFYTTAQQPINMEDHDSKPYYFGLSFGANMSAFRMSNSNSFAQTDTFEMVQAKWGPGFNVGLMGSLKLTNFVDIRMIPTIAFSNKPIYIKGNVRGTPVDETKQLESIYMHLPLQFKFKSERIHNFRFYGIAGAKFDYDLAANARSRRDDEFLKVKPFDLGGELGLGFEFYFPNFILAPELKLSQGFINSHFKDEELPLSNTIDQLKTRMIIFSLHIQG